MAAPEVFTVVLELSTERHRDTPHISRNIRYLEVRREEQVVDTLPELSSTVHQDVSNRHRRLARGQFTVLSLPNFRQATDPLHRHHKQRFHQRLVIHKRSQERSWVLATRKNRSSEQILRRY